MKLLRFDGGRIGVLHEGSIYDVTEAAGGDPKRWPPVDMVRLIANFEDRAAAIRAAVECGRPIDPDKAALETPVPWPNKLIAIPVNYLAHAEEMRSPAISRHAGFFMLANSSLSGPSEPIVLPDLPGRSIHHEAELAIIIGRTGRHVSREDALSHIFGYACSLDITVRGKQERAIRKSYDSFTPVGPWITTADEVGDPHALDLKLWVNGEMRQEANTRNMILDIPEIIAMCSAVMTLEPGDVILSGTPEGVGPIGDGDTVRIEIPGVGAMEVGVVQGEGGSNVAIPKTVMEGA